MVLTKRSLGFALQQPWCLLELWVAFFSPTKCDWILGLQSFPREQNNKRQVRHVGRYNKELILKSFVKFFQHGGCEVYCKGRIGSAVSLSWLWSCHVCAIVWGIWFVGSACLAATVTHTRSLICWLLVVTVFVLWAFHSQMKAVSSSFFFDKILLNFKEIWFSRQK